jgi:hypothetical protein
MMSTMCAEFATQAPFDGVPERRLERLRRAAVVRRAGFGLAVHLSRRRHAG